jgi:hypothetical protein
MRPDKRSDPAGSREALKAQLRALTQPLVPAHLERRLLTTVPVSKPISPRRRAVWATLLGVASAACLMAVLAWRSHHGENHSALPVPGESAQQDIRRPAFESPRVASWWEDWQSLDEEKLPAYTWPLDESAIPRASTSIAANLFD